MLHLQLLICWKGQITQWPHTTGEETSEGIKQCRKHAGNYFGNIIGPLATKMPVQQYVSGFTR
jgi:hypothetical protein